MGGIGGFTCIPEEVQQEIRDTLGYVDDFLAQARGGEMVEISLEQRITRLVIGGHIPLPCTLTAAGEFLGTYDTSSLPQAVLMSPAMGETAGRRSG